MDDDLFVIPSDNILLGEADGVFVGGDQDIISESESIVGPPGPPGPAGRDGRDGVDGQSATVTVGSTTTTTPGTDAIVTNVGTNLNAILNFSIPRGAVGETGPAGVDGVDGVDGSDGFSPIASVEQTEYGAEITITDSNGTTTAQVVNGSQGEPGTPGAAATVSVGSTTTGAAGTNASVVNSGTSSAAVLDFVIPRGADGAAGQDGTSATVTVGSTTTGNPGTNASVTNSGTSSAAVLNFTIPRGDTGAAGADGNDGQAATITVGSTTTGAAGTSASVTNTGTSSAAILDFVIPKGDTGATGPTPTPSLIATSTYMTMKAGFTASTYSYAYQFGNLMIVQLIINASSNFSSTQQKVAVISSSYWPAKAINYSASIGTDEWSLKGVGYLYISSANGEITIADYNNSGCKCAKINLSYIIN